MEFSLVSISLFYICLQCELSRQSNSCPIRPLGSVFAHQWKVKYKPVSRIISRVGWARFLCPRGIKYTPRMVGRKSCPPYVF